MESGTDTWVIVVAAFGGGLAGAVLQPLSSHLLGIAFADRANRRNVEQNLRRMLYALIDQGGRVAGVAWKVEARLKQNEHPSSMNALREGLRLPREFPLLQLWRIEDSALRGMAEEYMNAMDELREFCFDGALTSERLAELAERMTELPREMTLRMDKLNWPEAEMRIVHIPS